MIAFKLTKEEVIKAYASHTKEKTRVLLLIKFKDET